MARYLYGGGGDGDIIKPNGTPYLNATALVYNSRTGGQQVVDLQNISGASITQVTSDSFGQMAFWGPDNYIGVLWVDFGSGVRWALSPKAVDLAATRAITVQRAADATNPPKTAKAALPYSANDPLEQALAQKLDPMVIPRFSSQAARDAAFPSPTNGDRCYRTDLKTDQIFSSPTWVPYVSAASWTGTTFEWKSSGTAPVIGNGSCNVRYLITGRTVHFIAWMAFGTTTTFGTGTYTVTFPWNFGRSYGSAYQAFGIVSSSGGRFPMAAQTVGGGTGDMQLYGPTSAGSSAMAALGGSASPSGAGWSTSVFLRFGGVAELEPETAT